MAKLTDKEREIKLAELVTDEKLQEYEDYSNDILRKFMDTNKSPAESLIIMAVVTSKTLCFLSNDDEECGRMAEEHSKIIKGLAKEYRENIDVIIAHSLWWI